MFKMINQLLQLDEFYGVDSDIDILKGINRYPDTLGEAFKYAKRKIMSNNDKEIRRDSDNK